MSGPIELVFTPGHAVKFLDELWVHFPAHPQGPLVGAVHLVGDAGQILLRVGGPDVPDLVVLPGQKLVVADPDDPASWLVVAGPAPPRLALP